MAVWPCGHVAGWVAGWLDQLVIRLNSAQLQLQLKLKLKLSLAKRSEFFSLKGMNFWVAELKCIISMFAGESVVYNSK